MIGDAMTKLAARDLSPFPRVTAAAAKQRIRQRDETVNRLRDARLLRTFAYIDGKWSAAADGRVIQVTNPFDGGHLATVPDMGAAETEAAIEAASRAFGPWRQRLPQERAARLHAWFELMIENLEDLALIITLEQGKPIREARGEIDYAAGFVEWFGEEAKRLNGETIASHLPDRIMQVRRVPIGVTAAVTPWNFPAAMITRKAAAALAAGCPMVVRPASETPLSALALAELAERAGIPSGVFSVVTGDAQAIVSELCANPAVRALSFTGSTVIGKLLLRQGAETVKKMSMELGGHAPFLAFDDVDLTTAVAGAVAAKFQTTGQDCLAVNRIYVQEGIYEPFVSRFTDAVSALKVGNGLEEDTDIGPLMHERAVAKCEEHVRDAVEKGARLLTGGKRHALGGLFFEPTVLADVTPDMKIMWEETFGPVAAVTRFSNEDEAVRTANDTHYGLVSYLFTDDHHRIARVTEALDYGMVAVNCVKITGSPIPFGGTKESGLGREGSRYGTDEFTELKYICDAYRAA